MDERLRHLEREAAAGDAGARRRLLLERARLGDLDEERLRLAAYLGDRFSQGLLGGELPSPPAERPDDLGGADDGLPDELVCRIVGLAGFGREAMLRAAAALGLLLLRRCKRIARTDFRPELALRALEEVIAYPDASWEALKTFAEKAHVASIHFDDGEAPAFAGLSAAVSSGLAFSEEDATRATLRAARAALAYRSEERVFQAIARELIPWALEERDPLRERVGVRRRRER